MAALNRNQIDALENRLKEKLKNKLETLAVDKTTLKKLMSDYSKSMLTIFMTIPVETVLKQNTSIDWTKPKYGRIDVNIEDDRITGIEKFMESKDYKLFKTHKYHFTANYVLLKDYTILLDMDNQIDNIVFNATLLGLDTVIKQVEAFGK